MSEAHTKASRARMLRIPKKKRVLLMSALAKARWAKVPLQDRKEIARKLVLSRQKSGTQR